MKTAHRRRGVAIAGSVLALAGGVAALVPGASMAATTHNCGSKVITIERPAENGAPASKFKFPIEQITARGLSCQTAYSFLNKLYNSSSGTPEKYKCTNGHFKVPAGKVPETCTKPGKKIQFAGQGG